MGLIQVGDGSIEVGANGRLDQFNDQVSHIFLGHFLDQ
jgi:hypothetical protein